MQTILLILQFKYKYERCIIEINNIEGKEVDYYEL